MPEISIIVPIYNVEKYIHRCIDSILSQTFSDFELLLIDDGSPDRCGEICDEYAKKDHRIRVIHKENGGLSDARNTGLDIAKGNYFSFIDSDDFIEIDFYKELLEACKKNEADISMCGRYNVYDEKKKVGFAFGGQKIWNSKEAIGNLLIWNNIDSSACDKLFKKHLFNGIRFPIGRYNEDIYIMTNILNKASKIVHVGKAMYYYYHRKESITTESFSERKLDLLDASQQISDFININYPDLNEKSDSFYFNSIIFLYSLFKNKESIHKYNNVYNKIKKLMSVNFKNIMFCKYISKKKKILTLMLITHTYPLWIKFKKIIKG